MTTQSTWIICCHTRSRNRASILDGRIIAPPMDMRYVCTHALKNCAYHEKQILYYGIKKGMRLGSTHAVPGGILNVVREFTQPVLAGNTSARPKHVPEDVMRRTPRYHYISAYPICSGKRCHRWNWRKTSKLNLWSIIPRLWQQDRRLATLEWRSIVDSKYYIPDAAMRIHSKEKAQNDLGFILATLSETEYEPLRHLTGSIHVISRCRTGRSNIVSFKVVMQEWVSA